MSVIVAYSAAATGSPLNKAKPPKHSLNETGKFIILRLTVSPKIFPHCVLKPYCAIGQITTSRNRNTYRSCCNLSYAYVFPVTVGIITCVVEILAYDNIFI